MPSFWQHNDVFSQQVGLAAAKDKINVQKLHYSDRTDKM